MAFKSNKQRDFYFGSQDGKPQSNVNLQTPKTTMVSSLAPPPSTIQKPTSFKIPGMPKMPKFGRIKKNLKIS